MHTNHKRVGYEINPLVAAVTGVVVGAGMAVAGAVAMADKKNQARVKDMAQDVKVKAENIVKDVQGKVQNKKSEVENKAKKLENIAKNTAKDVKKI